MDNTISVSEQELRLMIREVVQKKISKLQEAQDLTARREVIHAAERASMDFEKVIIKTLNMVHPDKLPTEFQKRYLTVVEDMNNNIVNAVMGAAKELVKFPKNRE